MANKKKQQLRFYDGLVQLAVLAKEHITDTLRQLPTPEHVFSSGKDEDDWVEAEAPICSVMTMPGTANAYILRIGLMHGEQLWVWVAYVDSPSTQEQRDIESLGYADILILADAL